MIRFLDAAGLAQPIYAVECDGHMYDAGEVERAVWARSQVHLGWAIAAVAIRESPMQFQFRLRSFTCGTFHREDAEQYAYDQMARDWLPSEGWVITTTAVAVVRSKPSQNPLHKAE